jgi:hypothetical protein
VQSSAVQARREAVRKRVTEQAEGKHGWISLKLCLLARTPRRPGPAAQT